MPVFYPRVSSGSKSSSVGMWKCAFCGAMNEDENMVCDGCGDERPMVPQTASSKPDRTQDFEDMGKPQPAPPSRSLDEDEEDESLDAKDSEEDPLEADDNQNESDTDSDPFGSKITSDDDTGSTDLSTDTLFTTPSPSPASLPPAPEPQPLSSYPPPSTLQSDFSSSLPASHDLSGGRYYLVFVNTPAQALIKSRVSVDFSDFPVITIGRNPENIVVIPDQEVSRKHAQLSLENGKLVLKDLTSANGTYLYDGKEFQRVNGSVEIKPNSILKFGTGTIVRLENG